MTDDEIKAARGRVQMTLQVFNVPNLSPWEDHTRTLALDTAAALDHIEALEALWSGYQSAPVHMAIPVLKQRAEKAEAQVEADAVLLRRCRVQVAMAQWATCMCQPEDGHATGCEWAALLNDLPPETT